MSLLPVRPPQQESRTIPAAQSSTAVVRPHIERGELVSVLEEFSTPFPGFYLYYPARRQASPALRALIDYLLRMRRAR
jgi:DNA-binding transcriptional LysR family regulator